MKKSTDELILLALGASIKRLRHELNISQEKLADNCGFDRTYISLIERGKRNPAFTNLIKLSAGLGCSLSALIKGIK